MCEQTATPRPTAKKNVYLVGLDPLKSRCVVSGGIGIKVDGSDRKQQWTLSDGICINDPVA